MHNQSYAENIVLKATSWRVNQGMFIAAVTAGVTSGDAHLTANDLSSVDPRLPFVLEALIHEEPFATKGSIPGTQVRLLMNMWLKSSILRDENSVPYLVYNMTSVTHKKDDDRVTLHGSVFDMKTLAVPELGSLSPVLYWAQYKTYSLHTTKTILNEDLPDGLQRLEAALGLGYSEYEAVCNMLTLPKPSAVVELPPISF